MTKREFLGELERRLYGLPREDIEEKLSFFAEIIEDKIEEGISEEDAVAGIGTVDTIAEQILRDTPITTIAKERIKPKRHLTGLEIALLVIGSPIWLSLGIAAVSAVLSTYVVIWSVLISLWACTVAFAASGLGGIVAGSVFALSGSFGAGGLMIGGGLVSIGLGIMSGFGCKAATTVTVKLTRGFGTFLKKIIIKKEN